jgi:hypothetical protein
METNKKILGKINTQRCSVTLINKLNINDQARSLKTNLSSTCFTYISLEQRDGFGIRHPDPT